MRISDWSSDVCSSDLATPSCSSRCRIRRLRLDCLRASRSAALRKLPQRSAASAYRRCLISIDTRALVSLRGNSAVEERTAFRIHRKRSVDVVYAFHHLCDAPHAVQYSPRYLPDLETTVEIGRASCRERVCQYV